MCLIQNFDEQICKQSNCANLWLHNNLKFCMGSPYNCEINKKNGFPKEVRETVTKEEKQALIKMFECARTDPQLLLMLSVIRDVFIQNQMVKSYILRLENRVDELDNAHTELLYKLNKNKE